MRTLVFKDYLRHSGAFGLMMLGLNFAYRPKETIEWTRVACTGIESIVSRATEAYTHSRNIVEENQRLKEQVRMLVEKNSELAGYKTMHVQNDNEYTR